MSLHQHPTKGPGWWQIRISQGRKGKKITLPPFQGTRIEAEIYHADALKAYRPAAVSLIVPPLADLVPDFLAYYRTVTLPGTVAGWMRSWKQLEPYFGKLKPNQLAMTTVQHYKQQRLLQSNGRGGTISKRTINLELSYLASLIKWCESDESGPLIDPLPFKIKGFPGRQTRPPLPRVLTEDEVDRLLAELCPRVRGLVACLYYAGLRFSEAANLRAENVDLARMVLQIRGKGDKERIVPILPHLASYVSQKTTGLLFPAPSGEPYKDIRTSLKNAAARAGIPKHVHPHLLRHTFGAHGIKDISLRAMQTIMGHSTPVVTQRYTQIAEATLSNEMSRFRASDADGRHQKEEKDKEKQAVYSKAG